MKNNRGTSPNTRSAVRIANGRRKVARIHKELATVFEFLPEAEGVCPICKLPFSQCEYFQQLDNAEEN